MPATTGRKKYKPRAGEGAKATILTRYIYPRQPGYNPKSKEESVVVLIAEAEITINKKKQECYTFTVTGDDNSEHVCHAIKRYVHVYEEGDKTKVFDLTLPGPETLHALLENKVKWRKSKAKKVLYELLIDGIVPMEDGVMPLEDIYFLHEEFANYSFDRFGGRLKRLQKSNELNDRAQDDLEAFENFKGNHNPSLFPHKGYAPWQGLTAQELLWDDLEAYMNDPSKKPKDLWMSRQEYHDEFPLDAFRDKIKQEIRTAKYLRTIKARAEGQKV